MKALDAACPLRKTIKWYLSVRHANSLIGMTRHELAAALGALGVPDEQLRMQINQIWGWLYAHGVREFEQMSNVAKDLRESGALFTGTARTGRSAAFRRHAQIFVPADDKNWSRRSAYRAVAALYGFQPSRLHLDLPLLPHRTQKLVRNLTAAEITGQMVAARDDLQDWGQPPIQWRLPQSNQYGDDGHG